MARVLGPESFRTVQAPRPVAADVSAVPRAVADLGQSIVAIGKDLHERRQQAEDAGYFAFVNSKSNALFSETYNNNKNKALESGEGFPESIDKELQTAGENLLKEATEVQGFKPSREAQLKTQEYFSRLRSNFMVQAVTFENNSRLEKMSSQLDEAVDDFAISSLNSPQSLEDNILAAEAAIDAYEGLMPADRLGEVKTGARNKLTVSAVEGLINQDPAKALDMLQANVFDANLNVSQKNQLLSRARSGANRVTTANVTKSKELIKDELASLQRTGKRAGAISDEQIMATFGEDAAGILKRFDDEQQFYHDRQELALSSPTEDAALIQARAPEGVGFQDEAVRQDTLLKAVTEKYKKLGIGTAEPGDPVGYIETVAPEYLEGIGSDEPQEVRAAVDGLIEVQRKLGVPEQRIRIFSNRGARSLVNRIETTPGQDRAAFLENLQDTYGDRYGLLFTQLTGSGLSPESMVLAHVADDPITAQKVGQLIDMDERDLTSGLVTSDVNAVRENVATNLSEFFESFEAGDFTGAAAETSAKYQAVIEKLAILEFRKTGNSSTAAKNAANAVINDRYHIIKQDDFIGDANIHAYVPKKIGDTVINRQAIEDVAESRQQRKAIELFSPDPDAFNDPAAPEVLTKERIIRTAVNSGLWVTNERGDGLVLMLPLGNGAALPLLNKSGERYELKFLDAVRQTEDATLQDIGRALF